MKLKIKQGTTSKLMRLFVQDSAATDGSGKTGIAYNASGLTAYYLREGDSTATQITLASGTTGTYSSGGWSEVDSTNLPGIYEVGLPDACVDATSQGSVVVMFKGATDMAPVLCEIELDAVDYRDATDFGLSNLDAAVSSRSDLSQADVRTAVGLASANLDTQLGNIPTVSEFEARTIVAANYSTFDNSSDEVIVATNNDKTGYSLATSNIDTIADAIWDEALSGHNAAGSTGKALKQLKEGVITTESSINDSSATTTQFVTNLTESTTSYFSNKIMVFTDGHLSGQARIITDYNGTTKAITLEEPLTSAPSDGDQFLILATHENSIGEIADGVWNEQQSGHTTAGSFGYYLDSQVSAAGGGSSPTVEQIVDGVWDEPRAGHTITDTFGYFLDAQVSGAGSGGSGLYQVTVRVEDSSNDALQGARVNVDGTTLTLTTPSSGEVTFNLDSGVYLLNVSPPAGYATPIGQVVTVTTADISETFTLTGSGTCSPGWVG